MEDGSKHVSSVIPIIKKTVVKLPWTLKGQEFNPKDDNF